MRVVFLDFDGVLNSQKYIDWDVALYTSAQIDPRAVALVNDLVSRSDAKVVVSSSWRLIHTDRGLSRLLGERGFSGEIIGTTPRLHSTGLGIPRGRGDEIRAWLNEYREQVEGFVVLDDNGDEMGPVARHLILADPACGLVDSDVERACEVILKPAR